MGDLRHSLVKEIKKGERSIAAICREFNVSRHTAYKWLVRFDTGGNMEDLNRAPHRSPNKTLAATEELIVGTRLSHPCWGGRKIKAYLERRIGHPFPAASTVSGILRRHGLITLEASRAAMPHKRFERPYSNDLWQVDFKGHFPLLDGTRCYPLTVKDDHSRYSLCISAKTNERLHGVIESFLALFSEYGLPNAILCDNGNPWGVSACFGGHTKFEVFMMDYDILTLHGRPLHPQTQGKEERFHRTLKRELLANVCFENQPSAQAKFDAFRKEYNEERPHCALNYAVPADRYNVSNRIIPKSISEWTYPCGVKVRTVNNSYLCFNGLRVFLSEAFDGRKVAIVASTQDGTMDVIYRNFRIAQIDLREKTITSKKIIRLNEYA
jgi:transposase InsO family protein